MRHIKKEEVQINNDSFTHNTIPRKKHKKIKVTKNELLDLHHLLRFLNNKERDIFYLSCCAGVSQQMIRKLLGCYQSNVSYLLTIIRKRLKFAKFLHDNLWHILSFISNYPEDLTTTEKNILLVFSHCVSYKLTASVLDIDQGRIAIHLKNILFVIKKKGHKNAYNVLLTCLKNLNILKRMSNR